ncbi:hypothetical protein DFQ26_006091 [Actinomortierella ambigua]|nr:hypothetical protein DFQ26_006091 [Actinomortierella ambigua]
MPGQTGLEPINKDGYLAIMNDMNKIHSPVHVGEDVWTVEVETGVTVGDLDEFLRQHSPPLALPSNVVLTSVRYGGVLSLGCHGAATRTRTLPDLIAEVKIVDSNGTLRTFTKDKDPLEFSAATVNLGLLGVIYTYTLRVEPLFKLQMVDSLPLVSEYFDDPKVGGPKLKAMVLGNDQTEMFYWPFNTPGQDAANDYLWLKQWHRTNMTLTSSFVTDRLTAVFQTLQSILGRGVNELMVAYPPSTPHWISFITPLALRADNQVLDAPNAIHYQAGIDNLPCYDLEMGFKVDGNFENVVKAWKFVIDKVYEYASKGKFPMNFPLEMRFVKSSDALMSAAYDEDPEAIYCMIEILSAVRTPGFEEFSIEIGKYWMDNFHARPHWAKMWEHVPGIVPYLRQEAGSRFDKFDAIRKKYDPNDMFLTDTFAGVLGH